MPSKSDETHSFTANVYFDRKFAGHASNQGSGGETNFYPNAIGQGFCDYAGKDYVIELIDNQVHEKITQLDKAKKIRKIKKHMSQLHKDESKSMKAIFINAKDNTMSYILLDQSSLVLGLDSRDVDKIDKYIYSLMGYKRLFDLYDIGFEKKQVCEGRIYFDYGPEEITEGDVGFIINAELNGYEVDHYFGVRFEFEGCKYDGTYTTFEDSNPNRFKGFRFIGNAIIIAKVFTSLEQLSQMVKCCYMKKRDNQDAILPRYDSIEHSSHPKIVGMVGDGKDSEEGN
jgi:hypothetical protein